MNEHSLALQHYVATWRVPLISIQERVCYLAARSAVGWQCPTTMSKFLNQDYIISPASDEHSMAEILRSGISVQYESFLMSNFVPKSLWPDKNLTDLYPSLILFFSQNTDLNCSLEAFPGPLPTKSLADLTPIQELLPRETTYTRSLLITLFRWHLKNIV